ncbi:transcriptional repressor LexA [Bdellovibrio sp. HCB-110]|uniref:transcriptional repressor LexA n=1 Tax=Bdellovibrio sp. HCB-110 TaxID=3391182 RepID=UPI0039B45486
MTKKLPLPPLTPKEKSVLEFIESHILSSGVSPSYQEIKDHFGLASFNSVQNYLKQLTNKGYIENPLGQKRAIQVLHSASTVQEQLQSKSVSTKTGSPRSQLLQARDEILSLPLLGKVAAGQPIEALKHDEFVDVPPSMVRNPSKSFALKVQGDSMIEDGIFDEDIILVQKQESASNGDIIVATVENEATVKRFYVRARPDSGSSEKLVELRPSNSTMKSMWYSPEEVSIRGIVVGLIRKF